MERIDLLRSTARIVLDADGDQCRLTVVDGAAEVVLSASAVRIALPYAQARLRDVPIGGWLRVDEALAHWVALGGEEGIM